MEFYFSPAPPEHQKREKAKARELRKTQWWKNQIGRGVCHYCEQRFKPAELTMDHLVPIIRGGKTDRKNCVPACKKCNNEKGYKTLAEWGFEKNEGTRL
jgi:5-methylcytosine-specific restriction protein A